MSVMLTYRCQKRKKKKDLGFLQVKSTMSEMKNMRAGIDDQLDTQERKVNEL